VPTWLAGKVAAPGPDGERGTVLATDIDVSWMAADGRPAAPYDLPYDTARHDVADDEPPSAPGGEGFDLVHARLVLSHVPARERALARMARALRPGGWLVVEDFDMDFLPLACPDAQGPHEERANRLRQGFTALLRQRGVDGALGRTFARRLRGFGLDEVGADAYTPLAVPATRRLELANTRQVRQGLVALGIADSEIDAHVAALEQGVVDVATPPLVTAWGRRP
jgi:SAM-dependent methyltransferase